MFFFSRHTYCNLFACLIILFTGCAGTNQNFGKFTPDEKAQLVFESGQIHADYRYYISGGDFYPIAILALNKSYAMGNDLMTEMSFTEDSLRETIFNMQQRLIQCCGQRQFGFAVFDAKGNQIGILYTYMGLGIAFKVTEDNVVRIYGPHDDDQLKSYQDRHLGH